MDTAITPTPSHPSARHPALTGLDDATGPQLIELDAAGHSQALDCPAGSEIQVLSGRIWLTCEGLLDDHFLKQGQRLRIGFAARLHASAEDGRDARLRVWCA